MIPTKHCEKIKISDLVDHIIRNQLSFNGVTDQQNNSTFFTFVEELINNRYVGDIVCNRIISSEYGDVLSYAIVKYPQFLAATVMLISNHKTFKDAFFELENRYCVDVIKIVLNYELPITYFDFKV